MNVKSSRISPAALLFYLPLLLVFQFLSAVFEYLRF